MPLEDRYLETAIDAARRGGVVLQEWTKKFTVKEKSRANLVTEADVQSQEVIYRCIREQFPGHGFLGEEGLDIAGDSPELRWIIDPLDGTTNYVHGFPFYAVSIGLEHAGELIVGVIFDPTRDEIFTAVRGHGAFLNGQPIEPSENNCLAEAFCVASLPVGAKGDEKQIGQFLHILPQARTVQRTGSAALNLSYVACGRIDAYWSGTLKPWDQAGGALIVTEAGGKVSKMDGSLFDVHQPDLLATNGRQVHAELCRELT